MSLGVGGKGVHKWDPKLPELNLRMPILKVGGTDRGNECPFHEAPQIPPWSPEELWVGITGGGGAGKSDLGKFISL